MNKRNQPLRQGQNTHTIESLTEISIDLFMQRGYEATSVEEIARAAGITKSAIYYHVSSKEELLHRAVSRAVSNLFMILEEPAAKEGRPGERLKHIIRRLVEIEIDHLKEIALLSRVRGTTKTELWALEQRRDFDQSMQTLIAEAQAAGEIRSDIHPLAIDRLMFGMLMWICEWYHKGHAIPPDTLVDAAIAMIFDGIRQPSAGT